jgi:leucyl aminopeptidase (aminopeptidase T)
VRGVPVELCAMSRAPNSSADSPTGAPALRRAAERGGLVILADPPQAPWLFETVGRPDRGLRLPSERLYCDWLLPMPSLMRVLSADYGVVQAWRQRLMGTLAGAARLHVTTPGGTDLTLAPRRWLAEDGEVFTAPHEASGEGMLAIDGALYDKPPTKPILLRIAEGRVAKLDALARSNRRQRMLHADLTRDAGAAQVGELGLGINPEARPDGPIMEAEMALGTCHVGFGHNLPYGGRNVSETHLDVGLLRPTIRVDGQVICRDGQYCR